MLLVLIDCGLPVDLEMEPVRDELTDDDAVRSGRDCDCCGEVELAMRNGPENQSMRCSHQWTQEWRTTNSCFWSAACLLLLYGVLHSCCRRGRAVFCKAARLVLMQCLVDILVLWAAI